MSSAIEPSGAKRPGQRLHNGQKTLAKYVSHWSAAKMLGIPALDTVLASVPGSPREDSLQDISFTGYGRRFEVEGRLVHSSEFVPLKGSVLLIDGQAVAGPELVFLQMASDLDIQRLILLGLQICSHPPGRPEEALSTVRRIRKLIDKATGCHGYPQAARAAKYLADGSGSVMESLAFMLITLPPALGGYGVGSAAFNHQFKLDDDARRQMKQDSCFVDLFFQKAAVAVEYQSLAHHATAAEQGKDFVKASILGKMGIDVIPLSTIQLYNREACDVFAYNLAKRLGHRMQIRAARFEDMHAKLRDLLPTKPDTD